MTDKTLYVSSVKYDALKARYDRLVAKVDRLETSLQEIADHHLEQEGLWTEDEEHETATYHAERNQAVLNILDEVLAIRSDAA